MKTYNEILDFLFSQLPMYQRIGKAAYKADLNTTLALDKYFGHPHQDFKSIHVAGTNGKGSVSHCLAAILHQAGYKVGLYTSPHLKDFRERIKVNGKMIDQQSVVDFVEKHQSILHDLQPSFFEMSVAMAFEYFQKKKVDIAVIEVGLGGRLDSTNIITPEVSVITNIGLDHTAFLGNTLKKIAYEKAGIIKSGVPVVIGETQVETQVVFKETASQKNAPITFTDQALQVHYSTVNLNRKQVFQVYSKEGIKYPDLQLDLLGLYQRKNLITTLTTIEKLIDSGWDISKNDIYEGLSHVVQLTGLLGRWQTIGFNPTVICDTGHNTEGMQAIVEQINNMAFKKLHVIIGMVDDKDHSRLLSLLPANAIYYFTRASIPRSMKAKKLQEIADIHGLKGSCYNTPIEALQEAQKYADPNDLIFIGGSTFVVADILENLK